MLSTESSGSWDFTAMIDLLHFPSNPTDDRHNCLDQRPLLISSCAASEFKSESRDIPHKNAGHQRLGDFGPLWDVINKPSKLDRMNRDVSHGSPLPLGSSSDVLRDKESNNTTSHTLSKPISILERPGKRTKTKYPSDLHDLPDHDVLPDVLSDTTAGSESDGDVSVFDAPFTRPSALQFIPSQVGTPTEQSGHTLTPPSSCDEKDGFFYTTQNYHVKVDVDVLSTKCKTAVERKVDLVMKLAKQFPEFAAHIQPSQGPSDSASPVHVFVDSSNISIGLHDCHKIAHNIPVTTRIRRLPLSFHNFALILERGRPAAKRVLVGSDRFAAIKEAEKIGYETNILDRVHKTKHWTPRQLKFRNALSHGNHSSSEMGSVSEERWVEQGVDEILHLKMMESLVDTETPATIVLATGDAAEAEYSGGFLKMVERALQKGWTVELVSFGLNTSFAYKRKDFRAKWGPRFRMINLEDYVEEMLDM